MKIHDETQESGAKLFPFSALVVSRFTAAAFILVLTTSIMAQQTSPSVVDAKAVKKDPIQALIFEKLNTVIIPVIDFEEVSLEEAIVFLSHRSRELEVAEDDPANRGFNFVVRKGEVAPAAEANRTVVKELRLRNVTALTALHFICEQTHQRYFVDEGVIVISSKKVGDKEVTEPLNQAAHAVLQNKLNNIIIPVIDVENTSIEEAIDYLRMRSVELDPGENRKNKGVNFVIMRPANAGGEQNIKSLRLRNVTLATALKNICEQANFRSTVGNEAVILSPKKVEVKPVTPEKP
jgi:hypothetical protein